MEDSDDINNINCPRLIKDCEMTENIIQSVQYHNINDNVSKKTKKVWTDDILNLNIKELNKYIKESKLTLREIKQLKKQRRRVLNCHYAQDCRKKKRQSK
jgi:hypothetical protein